MVIDPVCGMVIPGDGVPPTASHHDATFYFCSRGCREHFLMDPDHYVTANERGESGPDSCCGCGKK